MTRDDVIRMAREAGIRAEPGNSFADDMYFAVLYRFATMAFQAGAAAEREACADICDQHASVEGIAQRCAEQIRARSKT